MNRRVTVVAIGVAVLAVAAGSCKSDPTADLAGPPTAIITNFSALVISVGDSASFTASRSEEHTSELQSRLHLVCRLLLEKKKKNNRSIVRHVIYPVWRE